MQDLWIARVMAVLRAHALFSPEVVIGFGLYQIYKGIKAKFRKRLKLGEMNETKDDWATWSGRIGYAARGVVFCIIGFFVIQAALHFKPEEAKGLDEALDSLAENYYGAWALGIVAVGLIATASTCSSKRAIAESSDCGMRISDCGLKTNLLFLNRIRIRIPQSMIWSR